MIRQSSPGSGRPDQKALNVNVDLLAEWTAERGRKRRQTSRAFTWFSIPILVAAVALPLLVHAQLAARERAALAAGRAQFNHARRVELEAKQKADESTKDVQSLKKVLGVECRKILDGTATVLNAAGPTMAFRSVKCEVVGSEIAIRCQADADSSLTAHRFVDSAGTGIGVKCSVLSAMRLNPSLGPRAVSFDYVKEIAVIR